MRERLFLIILIAFSTLLYGQEKRNFSTSEGIWNCTIEHIGNFKGVENSDQVAWRYHRIEKLSNKQFEYVDRMLGLYDCRRGDTFYILISLWPHRWSYSFPFSSAAVIVEMENNLQYRHWAFNVLDERQW